MSSLDPKDAVPDFSGLNEGQRKTLDQWESFFEKVRHEVPVIHLAKIGVEALDAWTRQARVGSADAQRYNIVGKVVP